VFPLPVKQKVKYSSNSKAQAHGASLLPENAGAPGAFSKIFQKFAAPFNQTFVFRRDIYVGKHNSPIRPGLEIYFSLSGSSYEKHLL
jgi:hypothetical protein